jgi:hypothetical protein
MQSKIFQLSLNLFFALVFGMTFPLLSSQGRVFAQNEIFGPQVQRCSLGTASGTYGYHMSGQIVGVGVFLVNGIFTHNTDGTLSGAALATIGNQQIPTEWTGGTWKINDDCTGSGTFFAPALNQTITYNFVASDNGDQIDLLNTNAGIVLSGVGRRISKAGQAPSCHNGMIVGTYSAYGGGSIPGGAQIAVAGTATHFLDENFKGAWTGADTVSFMGQFAPRINKGVYTLNSNCRGVGSYTDSLGAKINYTFTVVDGGKTIFFQGIDPGLAVQLVGTRLR